MKKVQTKPPAVLKYILWADSQGDPGFWQSATFGVTESLATARLVLQFMKDNKYHNPVIEIRLGRLSLGYDEGSKDD